VQHSNGEVQLAAPPSPAVAPPGPYLLFLDKKSDKGLIPSVAAQVFVGAPEPGWVSASAASTATVLGTSQVRPDPAAPAAATAPPASLPVTGRDADLPKALSLLGVGGIGLVARRRLRGRGGPG
jgi:hypothetical protein